MGDSDDPGEVPIDEAHLVAAAAFLARSSRLLVPRGRILRTLSPSITGSRDRAKRNAATMNTTLDAIKAAAERTR